MEVRAELRQLRISPRKVRLLAGVLRGMDVVHARYQLAVVVKKSSGPLSKLLDSAVANAKNNFNLEESNLFIKEVHVDEGPKLKRFRPKGFGRTSPIEKKTSHIRIILEERVVGLKGKKAKPAKKEEPAALSETIEESKSKEKFETKKPEIKKELGRQSKMPAFRDVKKLFRRKAV